MVPLTGKPEMGPEGYFCEFTETIFIHDKF